VQESKLLVKVNPVLPEKARQARVSGMVILQVLVNEDGEVADVKVLRGHPLLDDAAVEAVRQWRYSPTFLNGEPVPVIAAVNAIFNTGRLSVTLDQAGNLRDPVSQLEVPDLIQAMKMSPGGVTINPSPNAAIPDIEFALQQLQSDGIVNLQVPGFVVRDGRLFATVGYGPEAGDITAPSLAFDNDRLARIAKSSGLVENLPPREKPLLYQVFMNEVGEIVGLQQVRGPQIPAVENELMRTRVVSPGRRGGEPVPVVFFVEVAVP
jgi:TonB family protein